MGNRYEIYEAADHEPQIEQIYTGGDERRVTVDLGVLFQMISCFVRQAHASQLNDYMFSLIPTVQQDVSRHA